MDIWERYTESLIREGCMLSRSYWVELRRFLNYLNEKEFNTDYLVGNDQNRIEDGLTLRDKWFGENGYVQPGDLECTVLELLVALAIRMDREWIGDPEDPNPGRFFVEMLRNLFGEYYSRGYFNEDHFSENQKARMDAVLDDWMTRRFAFNGQGSPFPLKRNQFRTDCRKKEIWNQAITYISEKHMY